MSAYASLSLFGDISPPLYHKEEYKEEKHSDSYCQIHTARVDSIALVEGSEDGSWMFTLGLGSSTMELSLAELQRWARDEHLQVPMGTTVPRAGFGGHGQALQLYTPRLQAWLDSLPWHVLQTLVCWKSTNYPLTTHKKFPSECSLGLGAIPESESEDDEDQT